MLAACARWCWASLAGAANRPIGAGRPARTLRTIHALTNVTALVCLKSAQSHRDEHGRLDGAGLGLAIAGGLALCVGGWLGGELVYREHVGVQEDAHRQSRHLTGHEPHTHEVRTLDVAVF